MFQTLRLDYARPGHHERRVSREDKAKACYYDVYEPSAPMAMLEQGKKELLDFAADMLTSLVVEEDKFYEGLTDGPSGSGLRYFARLDIGVLLDRETGRFSYWLNEVERGHCTGLFSEVTPGLVDSLAPTLVVYWEQALSTKQQKQGADD